MNVVVMDFVEAARLRGEGLGWIMRREILPNIMPPLIAEFGLRFCFVFLTICALSFLGVGIQPPTADWGSMVRENATLITYGDITPLLPAGAIALLTVAVNFVVDWFLHDRAGSRMSIRAAAAPRAKGDPLLEIRGLHIEGFSDDNWHQIVKGIDLTLKRGEVLGLIGESGAGKSTIGLAAMGYARPGCRISGGSIVFDGIDLARPPRQPRRELWGSRIAYVAQSAAASFNPAHRIIEQTIETVLAPQSSNGATRPSRTPSISTAGCSCPNPDAIGGRYPHQVSGGQLQRAMTAMAMSCRPDLIIFDEPTTALDVTTQVEVLAAIRNIVDQFQTAAIYITHDLAVVAQMADRIMVLRYGQLVEEAPTRDHAARRRSEDYTKLALGGAQARPAAERPSDEPVLRGRRCHRELWRHASRFSRTSPSACRAAAPSPSSANPARASRRSPASSPACCRRSPARIQFDGSRPAAGAEGARQGYAAPHPDDLSVARHRAQPAPDRARHDRPAARVLSRPERRAPATARSANCSRLIELDESLIDRLPGELSGGQKQRICIARALAAEPELIICDEVTSALDQIVQEEILKLLMRLQQDTGVSYLFITHDIATVRAIADEIVVMHRARSCEQGPKTEVLSPPHPAYTDLLLSSVPEMDPDWLTGLLARRADQGGMKAAGN